MTSNSFSRKSFRVLSVFLRITMVFFLVLSVSSLKVHPVIALATDISISNDSVDENIPGNFVVGILSSDDPVSTGTFSLVNETEYPDNASFNIAGAQLIARVTFDYETKSSYLILVRVTDGEGLFYEEVLTINVIDVNEAPTDINLSNNTIEENLIADTAVGTLSSSDPDAGDTFTYSLVAGTGDTDNGSFNISGDSLRASDSFDFETQSSYSVRIQTTDFDGLIFAKAFTITVTNVNETPTDITLSNDTIAENSAVDTEVGTLSSTDPDVGDIFSYALVTGTGDADNGFFDIVGNSLRASESFDFETQSSYSVRIETTDANSLTFAKAFTITVTNVNEVPTDITLSNDTIAENSAVDTEVGTLSSTDPDTGDTFTYALVAGDGDTDNGSYNIVDNSLRASVSFDFETQSSYSVRIQTTDFDGLTFAKAFSISVTNVNETPTDIILSNDTIAENSAVDTELGTLSSTDPDVGDTFTYALVTGDGDTDNGSFNIVDNSLRASVSFDFEIQSSYSVRIQTTDFDGLTFAKAFSISVTNVNEAPIVTDIPNQTVVEGASFTTINLDDYVSDMDNLDSELSWSYSGNTELTVDIDVNRVATISVPNADWNGSEQITFRATDPGALFSEDGAMFEVTAVNDAPVITGQVILSTQKNVSLEITLADLNVSDVDNTYPADFTLTVLAGTDYTFVGNTITPATDFVGTLTVPVKVNDGLADSNTYNLSVNVTNLIAYSITNTYGNVVYLQADFSSPISNKMIDFTLDGMTACSALTDSSGHAICTATLLASPGNYPAGVYAEFSGDADIAAASATAQLYVFARNLNVSATGVDKTYDGTIDANVNLLDDRIAGDELTLSVTYETAIFSDANVGTGKTVSVGGISVSGSAAVNYILANFSTTTTADILAKEITVTADNGQFKFLGQPDPVLTYGYSPNDPPVAFSGALSRDPGEDLGDYAITQGTLSAGDNYTIIFVSNLFSIVTAYNTYLPMVLK